MVKFMILFHKPRNIDEFERGYATFLAMIEEIPNITRRQVVHITGSPEGESAYYKVLEIYFDDFPAMQAALNSDAGQRAGAGLYEVFKPLKYTFETAFADVYEEAGGQSQLSTESDT